MAFLSKLLGWEIGIVAVTISVPPQKLEQIRDLLHAWSSTRTFASEHDLPSLVGQLLYLCEVVRRMLIAIELRPVRAWAKRSHVSRGILPWPRIHSGPEFHADVAFWMPP